MVDVDTKRPGSRVGRAVGRVLLGVAVTVLVLVVAVVAVLLWWSHDVTTPDDGDRVAVGVVEQTATEVAEGLEARYDEPLDAETLAQRAVDLARTEGYDVTVLGWSGASGDADGARVDLEIAAEVEATTSPGLFGDSRTAGSARSCWQFVVRAHEHDDTADRESVECPDVVTPATPEPTPLPSLDPDAEEVVLGVVDGLPDGASADEAERALRAAFPEFVDVRAERAGADLVATVGVVRSRDCVVGVRADGASAWRFSDFDRIQLEPGEGGCDPGLYLAPVTTH